MIRCNLVHFDVRQKDELIHEYTDHRLYSSIFQMWKCEDKFENIKDDQGILKDFEVGT